MNEMENKMDIQLNLKDKFRYPVDAFGITAEYELTKITGSGDDAVYLFKPLSKCYIWKNTEYSFTEFKLKRKDIYSLIHKGIWLPIVNN
jgi:hypothetical protein